MKRAPGAHCVPVPRSTCLQGMHGVRLRPGSSLVELRVRLHNRTPLTQTFLWCVGGWVGGRVGWVGAVQDQAACLAHGEHAVRGACRVHAAVCARTQQPRNACWLVRSPSMPCAPLQCRRRWANAAVHANEQYQSFFPPDVHYVAGAGPGPRPWRVRLLAVQCAPLCMAGGGLGCPDLAWMPRPEASPKRAGPPLPAWIRRTPLPLDGLPAPAPPTAVAHHPPHTHPPPIPPSDHAKRATVEFPVCRGRYYGVDYRWVQEGQLPVLTGWPPMGAAP